MVDVGECIEIIDECDEGLDEATGDIEAESEEEIQELQDEIVEARENVSIMRSIVEGLNNVTFTPLLKIGKFIGKNAAIATVFFLVQLALNFAVSLIKTDPKKKEDAETKLKKIKALNEVIVGISKLSEKLKKWMTAMEHVTIEVDGIEIPLVDILFKYTEKILEDVSDAYDVAKQLKPKGKKKSEIPNTEQVATVVTACDSFVQLFTECIDLAEKKSSKYQELKTFPVSKEDVDALSEKLNTLKHLPY